MNLLAFDTSTDTLSIAVQRGESESAQTWHHTGPGGAQASTALIPAIQQLMADAGLRFDQLDAIAFGRGPGSFTGLRTACSVAQGLAFGAGVPVLPVDTLMAVAEEARFKAVESGELDAKSRFNVLALLDARMDEVYAANYEFDSELFNIDGDYKLIRPEGLVVEVCLSNDGVVAGNTLAVYGERLAIGAAVHIHALPTASAMLRLAPALMAAGQAVSADQALPIYIRDKVARTTQERMADKAAALA
jgi:tRNA threonylcarbamoyladenosine biosynthesis protein TsaB